MKLDIEISFDDDDAQDMVSDIVERGRDFRPVFRQIREDLRAAFSRNFASNGLEVGGWRPLDADYASWKSVNFPGAPPMVRTGALFRSLSSLRGKGNEIDRNSARFGTSGIRYASFHQYGTTKMPKREVVFIPQGAEVRWSKMAVEYLTDGEMEILND
jgi:phage gpG-like protein